LTKISEWCNIENEKLPERYLTKKEKSDTMKQPAIAIMLLVHNNEKLVNRLIKHLSKDFDVYVHIDKRFSIKINQLKNVFIYKKFKTYWGSFTIVIATLFLLKKAFEKGYDRYILISGQDLPIKTNNEIKNYFQNNSFEYLNIGKIPNGDGWPNMDRLTGYNLNNIYRGIKGKKVLKLLYRIISKLIRVFSRIIPRKIDYDFYGGDQWTNYTHNCVKKIFEYLGKDKKYIKRYKWTSCSDEIFFQRIISKLDGLKIEKNSLRYIDWKSGPEYPKILRMDDFQEIINSNSLFARKFDEKIDNKIIEMIYKRIEN
jgi:predicted nucleic acid-binding Zn finger protein